MKSAELLTQLEDAHQDWGTTPPAVHNVDKSEGKARPGLVPQKTQLPEAFLAALPKVPPGYRFARYHCSPEWHLVRLIRAPFAGVLYSFAFRIAKKSKRFHGSVLGLAEYFGVSRWKVQRAMKALVKHQFFVLVDKQAFCPSVYRVVSHKEWAQQHPGRCAVKEAFPWSAEEGDKLGVDLWNASGGKVKYQEYQVVALRKTGLTDDQIIAAFKTFFRR